MTDSAGPTVVRADAAEWQPLRVPGISIRLLRDEQGCVLLATLPKPIEILKG